MAKVKKLTAAQRRKNGLPLHLSLSPQPIKPDQQWYYEEPKHVHVVAWSEPLERATSRGEKIVVHVKIPWSRLANSMRRYRSYKRAVGKTEKQP
jgi:hypothetical protein